MYVFLVKYNNMTYNNNVYVYISTICTVDNLVLSSSDCRFYCLRLKIFRATDVRTSKKIRTTNTRTKKISNFRLSNNI